LEALTHIDPKLATDLTAKSDDYEIEMGGLHIIGSSRHESRRIDRQLRGRAGRQGDPGASQFFLSLEDDLMRLFGSDRLATVMEKMGAQEGEVITAGMVTKSIERAQKRVEGNNFESRKKLLDYDDVMNQQREVIYDLRLFALEGGEDLKGELWEMIEHAIQSQVAEYCPPGQEPENWDLAGLRRRLLLDYFVVADRLPEENTIDHDFFDTEEVRDVVREAMREGFRRKLEGFGEHSEKLQSWILLSVIDDKWKDHLYDLDHLKSSIAFRGWGQKDPLVEYKREAYEMFVDLMEDMRKTLATMLFRAQIGQPQQQRPAQRLQYTGPAEGAGTAGSGTAGTAGGGGRAAGAARVDELGMARGTRTAAGVGAPAGTDVSRLSTNRGEASERKPEPVTVDDEPGRNDPCPCGSGKKYKKCHGAQA
ncbi:MAG: SEC-C metal-binding domain-containing protein, partial [Gemmatimonadota bacterium]